jgi:hypothetical protein
MQLDELAAQCYSLLLTMNTATGRALTLINWHQAFRCGPRWF